MKIPTLPTLVFALAGLASPLALHAQTSPSLGAGLGGLTARTAADAGGELQRFDLDFPGGTPDQFVAAITKAMERPLNAIVPNDRKNAAIMPIKVFGVTVPELFSALEAASAAERPLVTTSGNGSKNVQFRTVSMGFRPNVNNITDETVWSFYSTQPTPEFLQALGESRQTEQVCQYFQLAPYLVDHSVEDITTAIQTGWKMLKITPMPQLSFHEETKLLIAVGQAAQIAQIPQVLEQLQRDNTAAATKIGKLQSEVTEIEAKKEPGWEAKAEELRHQIFSMAAEQRARNEMKSSAPTLNPSPNGRPGVRSR
jgi:hypothetical protein